MKLLFKHILRTIKKAPLQPVIILLTLIMSVATFLIAVKLTVNVYEESSYRKGKYNDTPVDITVNLSGSDEARMLFAEDVEAVVGEDGSVLGEFMLSAIIEYEEGGGIISIAATDLLRADDFYKFKFTEYGEFTTENLNQSIIFSSKTAKSLGLKVGDVITLKLLGEELDMTVGAIALPNGPLFGSEAVINIGSVTSAIAEANPALASLADSITPYTDVRVSVNDDAKIGEVYERLESAESLRGKTVIDEAQNIGSVDFFAILSLIVIAIASGVIISISAVVISTSLELLSKKRLKDSALFMLSGADPDQLSGILYLECAIYSILGAGLGLLLSVPIANGLNTFFIWSISDISFKLYDIPLAFVASPLIVLLTARMQTQKTKRLTVSERISDSFENTVGITKNRSTLVFLIISIILIALTLLLPVKDRYFTGLTSAFFIGFFAYAIIPTVVTLISSGLIRLIEKAKKIPARTILALKNVNTSYPLKHTARLIGVLVALVIVVLNCLDTFLVQKEVLETVLDSDYVSVGADERSDEIIKGLDGVDGVFRVAMDNDLVGCDGTEIIGISISDDAEGKINPKISPKRLPKGDEIVITTGYSVLSGAKVGDKVRIAYKTTEYEFTVIEIVAASTNIAFFDATYIGQTHNMLCIKSSAQKGSEEYLKIVNTLESRGSELVENEAVVYPLVSTITSYGQMVSYVTRIAIISTALGIMNVLFSAFLARKQERSVYYTVGMTKKDIILTGALEIAIVLFIALLTVPFTAFLISYMVDLSTNSFGVDLLTWI